tara:strand:+ start:16230 stop:16868 length:639 start_codon:yes stop_codon:yes gene_type:complete
MNYTYTNSYLPHNLKRESNFYLGGALKKEAIKVPPPVLEPMKKGGQILADEILNTLENTQFPTKDPYKDKTRKNVLQKEGQKIEAFVLGKVRAYDKPNLVNSVKNVKFPLLFEKLKAFVKHHNPNFKYTSIQINKSVETPFHFDRGNRGLSYLIGLGDFKGGGVGVKTLPDLKVVDFDNKNKWLKFDGHTLEHKSLKKTGGTRYALIYYTHF